MRQKNVGDRSKGYLRGAVVKIRTRPQAPPLYDVLWDNDTTAVDKGYLAHGLQPEIVLESAQ